MAKKQKANYVQNAELSTTGDETTPLEIKPKEQAATEATVESTKEALRDTLVVLEFEKIESAYNAICQKLIDGVLPKAEDAIPVFQWYQKHIYPVFDIPTNIEFLKKCSQGFRWKAFFYKNDGLATMQNSIRNYIKKNGAEE